MKPAKIFHQYIWIINTLRAYRKLALEHTQALFHIGTSLYSYPMHLLLIQAVY